MRVFNEKSVPTATPSKTAAISDGVVAAENHDLDAYRTSLTALDMPPPFRLLGAASHSPAQSQSAIVVSCPHAGRYYPDELVAAGSVGLMALRDLEDFAVDHLLSGIAHTQIGGISNMIARAYLDVNRPEDALDQAMFHDHVQPAKQSRKVLAGYGLLPRLTGARIPIHDELLSVEDASRRIHLAYRPYHGQLQQLLEQARQTHGHYLLIDCHSMPAVDNYNRKLADVVLGNCHGRTLAPHIGKQLEDFIRSYGYSVAWNTPYSGGFITSHYGSATSHGQSLQIEINRALYMDDPYQLKEDGAADITRLMASILTFLDKLMRESKIAP